MKLQIKEFATLTGVSVRTLHYYDEIGLLKPSLVDKQSSYRYYDEAALRRMQEILFYRELDFSLKSICSILAAPGYDKKKVLEEQKMLLILKKERLERIIEALESHQRGEELMKAWDNTEFEMTRKQYEEEAKERWGKTDAYKEYTDKKKGYSGETYRNLAQDMDCMMEEFAHLMQEGAEVCSGKVQEQVRKLQNHITNNYYTCTDEILAGLGQMYVADERFRKNIDKHAVGTAEYVSEAIRVYCM